MQREDGVTVEYDTLLYQQMFESTRRKTRLLQRGPQSGRAVVLFRSDPSNTIQPSYPFCRLFTLPGSDILFEWAWLERQRPHLRIDLKRSLARARDEAFQQSAPRGSIVAEAF